MSEPRRVVIVVFPGGSADRRDRPGRGVPHRCAASTRPATRSSWSPPEPGPVRSSTVGLTVDRTLAACRGPIDTLVVAGRHRRARGVRGRAARRLACEGRRSARAASARSAPAPSCSPRPGCSRAAARRRTGPAAPRSPSAIPAVTVEPDQIFVRDGDVYTSAGVTAGMDLALALVEDDLGRATALEVARWLVLFVKRPGGQSQFSAQLAAQTAEREPLRDLQDWIAGNLDADLSVPALAGAART